MSALNCCTRCGFTKHTEKSCNFVFHSNCKHCDGKHYSWLCCINEQAKTVVERSNESESEAVGESEAEIDCESEYESESLDGELANMCSITAKKTCLQSYLLVQQRLMELILDA